MLVELAVRNLGVIAEARIPMGAGMTVLSGETGAGKTMVVEALRLLSGAKADPSRVRSGAPEAVVEAMFAVGDTEWVIRRVVPASGRSRCYLNGELVTANELAELASGLLEIHGQHSQLALADRKHQRGALDRFAGADPGPLDSLRTEVASLEAELEALGGDERARQRQLDLLRHQIHEIESVAPEPGEDETLADEENLLAGALEHRAAAAEATELLAGDDAASDLLARAGAVLGQEGPFREVAGRLAGLTEELADCVAEVRSTAEAIEPDEERLGEIRERRQALVDLRRKYGDSLAEVQDFLAEARAELAELEGLDEKREAVSADRDRARTALAAAAQHLGDTRRRAAPQLARAVADVLCDLALATASMEVSVEDTGELPGAGEAVEIRISTNPGMRPGPLSKVASGGELSRVMLALRLVLSGGPPTMVFDEVDAGIGGSAAVSVGSALGSLAEGRQVVVVTHLPQVAAFADAHVLVEKFTSSEQVDRSGVSTLTGARLLGEEERVVELSRMLSGSPDSDAARTHAEELLRNPSGAPGPAERR